jgi:hypothetical protein
MVLYVGAHSQGIDSAMQLVDHLPGFLSGLYIQVSPLKVVSDSPTKLEQVTALYGHAVDAGLTVIAGHAGAITPALRAIGIHAADAGLASGETFDMSTTRRPKKEGGDGKSTGGGPASRMYLREVGHSFDAKTLETFFSVQAVRDRLAACRLACHRFIGGDPLARAREHSLWARVADASDVSGVSQSMRTSIVADVLTARRSTITAVNQALGEAGLAPIDTRPADNHLNWFSRLTERRDVA